ncbi:hypothetical protein [Loktanella sp. SALINAS62]|uniref:hypothetical protein n=1 Tax=Loktanella sp. SALINAS62 TaxID=2706124 RepID=UPI001B8BA1D2|nr:hypothetical protein [Loktanella sp. SALINAS62]MBS1301992.1 hypothetical protein [Loktanella sp. SALINAS62]
MAKVGRPKTDSTPVLVRLSPAALKQLDDAIVVDPDQPSRPEMIRRILEDWFKEHPND